MMIEINTGQFINKDLVTRANIYTDKESKVRIAFTLNGSKESAFSKPFENQQVAEKFLSDNW